VPQKASVEKCKIKGGSCDGKLIAKILTMIQGICYQFLGRGHTNLKTFAINSHIRVIIISFHSLTVFYTSFNIK